MEIGTIVLAAGSSSRLGEPKQLLEFAGETLLNRSIRIASASNCRPIIVVLGANAEKIIRTADKSKQAQIAVCENWADGMSASIKFGVTKLLEIAPNLSAILILLCDQPFVTTETIARLIESQKQTKKPIAVSEYANVIGVPALFARQLFPELLNLIGDAGAKNLFKKYANKLTKISAPEAAFDVDTRDDYDRLRIIDDNK